jgi:hypothetical protein
VTISHNLVKSPCAIAVVAVLRFKINLIDLIDLIDSWVCGANLAG